MIVIGMQVDFLVLRLQGLSFWGTEKGGLQGESSVFLRMICDFVADEQGVMLRAHGDLALDGDTAELVEPFGLVLPDKGGQMGIAFLGEDYFSGRVYRNFMVPDPINFLLGGQVESLATQLQCFLHALHQGVANGWRRGCGDQETLIVASGGVCHGQGGIAAKTVGQQVAVFLGLFCGFHVLFAVNKSHVVALIVAFLVAFLIAFLIAFPVAVLIAFPVILIAKNVRCHWLDGAGGFLTEVLLPEEAVTAVSQTLPLPFREVDGLGLVAEVVEKNCLFPWTGGGMVCQFYCHAVILWLVDALNVSGSIGGLITEIWHFFAKGEEALIVFH